MGQDMTKLDIYAAKSLLQSASKRMLPPSSTSTATTATAASDATGQTINYRNITRLT